MSLELLPSKSSTLSTELSKGEMSGVRRVSVAERRGRWPEQ